MTTRRTLIAGMLFFLVFGLGFTAVAPTPASAAEVTLRYSFFAPPWTFPGMQMQEWAREVEKRTNGTVKVETYPGGSLLGAKETYQGVKSGIADVGLSLPSYDPRQFPVLSVFSLPLQMPNATVASQVLWDIIQEYDPKSLDEYKVITAFTTEPAYIQSSEPVRNLEDLKGMEMRTRGASIPIAKALGISPQGMPMPSVPEALQKGVIAGNITSREVLKDFKIAPYVPYVVDYPTDVGVFVAVMNKSKWQSLPQDAKNVINGLRREMAVWTGSYHDFVNVEEALKWSKQKHDLEVIELSDEQKQKWDKRLEPVVDQWIEEKSNQGIPAQEIVNRVKELRDKYSKIWTVQLED